MAKNSGSLNEDKLKPELEALAAGILRENKNVKKVKITAEARQAAPRTAKRRQGLPRTAEERGEKGEGQKDKGEKKSAGKNDGEKSDKKESSQEGQEEGENKKAGEESGERPGEKGEKGNDDGGKEADKEKGGEEDKKDTSPGSGQAKGSGQEADKGEKEKEKGEEAGPGEKPGQGDWQAGGRKNKTDSDLDSTILNPDQEEGASRELREKKSSSAKSAEDEGAESGAGTGAGQDEPKSLRERVSRARQAMNLKEMAKQKLEATVTAPAKQGLNQLLKQAWINLPDSFGLTLIWINIHVFLKWVLGEKLFCKLGEEWLPKQITEVGGEAAKTAGKGIGLIEVIALLILDLIVLAVILLILALIVMIVDFMQAGWWEKFKLFVGGLTNLDWSTIKALFQLF